MHSQIKSDSRMRSAVSRIQTPITVQGLMEMRHIIDRHIHRIAVNSQNEDHEISIRWKRSAIQIWHQAFAYTDKDCTDIVTVFQALCRVFNLTTRLVRVHDKAKFHSIVEVLLKDGWYIYDIAAPNSVPEKGRIKRNLKYGRWSFIRRGRTAWGLNLDRVGLRRHDVTPTPIPR